MSQITTSTQDYLKAIYTLSRRHGRASTNDLATHLNVRPASVTNMLQKLAEADPALVVYRKHRGGTLTPAGQKAAIRVIRRHRLIETYLYEKLGYSWDEVHEEAEQLEHVVSAKLVERIAEALGYPETDPHGHPIPSADLAIAIMPDQTIATAPIDVPFAIHRIRDENSDLLSYLEANGIKPGIAITITARDQENCTHLTLTATDQTLTLREEQASQIFVSLIS